MYPEALSDPSLWPQWGFFTMEACGEAAAGDAGGEGEAEINRFDPTTIPKPLKGFLWCFINDRAGCVLYLLIYLSSRWCTPDSTGLQRYKRPDFSICVGFKGPSLDRREAKASLSGRRQPEPLEQIDSEPPSTLSRHTTFIIRRQQHSEASWGSGRSRPAGTWLKKREAHQSLSRGLWCSLLRLFACDLVTHWTKFPSGATAWRFSWRLEKHCADPEIENPGTNS